MMAEKVKVKSGDTMSALAKKAGVSLADFIAANPQITNPNLIRPGQFLNIPTANPTASTTDSAASIRPDAEYDEKMAAATGGSVVDQNNSTTSNVDNNGTFAGSDKDVQELDPVKEGKDAIDAFDVEKYTKDYLDKVTEAEKDIERKSAFNILKMEFEQYGLGSLVDKISNLLTDGTPPAEFGLRLRGTQEYKDRFKANEVRLSKGLSALSPADYVALEDKYQDIMRNYDLPESYYTKDETGRQVGFEQLLGNDVSSTELENRIITAKDRVVNANPEVSKALKQFYPDITNGDILAYALDPKNALKTIQSKVTAAEIGGAAMQSGLGTSLARAEELQKYGVDKASATEGYSAIGSGLQRGSELAAIYGESPYAQATAESEVFKLTGQAEARKQRQKVTGLEKATFGGQSGVTSGALARDRAGGI
jgi:murein DD-endopeptidase MepM/ murein hydrolase activator NlpD